MRSENQSNGADLTDLALELNSDQTSEDSWSQPATLQSRSDAPSGADLTAERAAARRRATELLQGGMTNAADIRRAILAELRTDVPVSTVRHWVRSDRARIPPPSIGAVADRVLRLASSELGRLEQSSGQTDLERLSKVAQILKTLQGLSASGKDGKQGPRTLQDLNAAA